MIDGCTCGGLKHAFAAGWPDQWCAACAAQMAKLASRAPITVNRITPAPTGHNEILSLHTGKPTCWCCACTPKLSPRLEKVNRALRNFVENEGHMPTRKALAHALGDKTLGPMTRDLRRLEAAGCIKLHPRGTIPAVLT